MFTRVRAETRTRSDSMGHSGSLLSSTTVSSSSSEPEDEEEGSVSTSRAAASAQASLKRRVQSESSPKMPQSPAASSSKRRASGRPTDLTLSECGDASVAMTPPRSNGPSVLRQTPRTYHSPIYPQVFTFPSQFRSEGGVPSHPGLISPSCSTQSLQCDDTDFRAALALVNMLHAIEMPPSAVGCPSPRPILFC